jgi:hypothetical protein
MESNNIKIYDMTLRDGLQSLKVYPLETKIECVYDGQFRNRDMEISDLVKEINTRIKC